MKKLEKLTSKKFESFKIQNPNQIIGGGTSIFSDINNTKRKWDGDRNHTYWGCDSSSRCEDAGNQ